MATAALRYVGYDNANDNGNSCRQVKSRQHRSQDAYGATITLCSPQVNRSTGQYQKGREVQGAGSRR